jgi:aspartate aminotransferase
VKFTEILKNNKVLVVPGTGFGKKGYFRISFCVDWDSIKGSISGFKKAIDSID